MADGLSLLMALNVAVLLYGLVAMWRRQVRPLLFGLAVQAIIAGLAALGYSQGHSGDELMAMSFLFIFAVLIFGGAVVLGVILRLIRGGPAARSSEN